MKTFIYNMNRSVHLARRDAFLDKALEYFKDCRANIPFKKLIEKIDATLYCLQGAVDHGAMTLKSAKKTAHNDALLLFTRMVLFELYSVRIIMENESQLKNHQSPLRQFLQNNGKLADPTAFARSGEQLLQDVANLLEMAKEPFMTTRQTSIEHMEANEKLRYQRAYEGLKKHLSAKKSSMSFTLCQTFSPIPGMRCE